VPNGDRAPTIHHPPVRRRRRPASHIPFARSDEFEALNFVELVRCLQNGRTWIVRRPQNTFRMYRTAFHGHRVANSTYWTSLKPRDFGLRANTYTVNKIIQYGSCKKKFRRSLPLGADPLEPLLVLDENRKQVWQRRVCAAHHGDHDAQACVWMCVFLPVANGADLVGVSPQCLA
jgi:hypothetical protein